MNVRTIGLTMLLIMMAQLARADADFAEITGADWRMVQKGGKVYDVSFGQARGRDGRFRIAIMDVDANSLYIYEGRCKAEPLQFGVKVTCKVTHYCQTTTPPEKGASLLKIPETEVVFMVNYDQSSDAPPVPNQVEIGYISENVMFEDWKGDRCEFGRFSDD